MKHESIQEIFDRAVAQFGPLPAVERGGDALSYAELARRSNRLANFLIASGLRPGARVAVLTEDIFDVVTAMLASFKARCVYVPLDPSAPEKRLAALAADVTPEVFVTEPGLLEVVGRGARGARAVCLCGGGADAEGVTLLRGFESFADEGDPGLAPEPDDTCYVYFTSGSTGRPKGIAGRLKAVSHFIRWETRELGLGEGVRVSQLVSTTFDAFLRDIFVPLSVGGTVCAPPDREALLDPVALVAWLDRVRVNLVHCVPSQFRAILSGGVAPEVFEALRHVLLSGEPLLPSDVRRWTAVFGDRVRLVNLYGPTETTMTKFFYFVKPSDAERPFVPIGQPMPGARAILLDERGLPCPPGAVGEIYIRTPFRSHGYWNRPDLTREVFVQNPFSQNPQDVIYKTGDLARVLEDGDFQILGRKDQQVKVRGVRVELTEVEGLLREHEAVADAAVAAHTDPNGFGYLCAYVAPKVPVESGELRAFLAAQLPAHTLPSSFVFVESLPLTPSGKLDRQALASLGSGRGAAAYVAPRNDHERKLVEIWQEVLGREGIGVGDNFFEVGGHSLIAMRAVSRIHKELNAHVELREFFAHPTVEALARLIGSSRPDEYVEIQPTPERPFYEVSNAQRRLWVLSQLEDDLRAYNMWDAYVLEGALDAAAFVRAFAALVERHESLRTTFAEVEGHPVQRVHPAADFPFEVERADLRGRPDAEAFAAEAADRDAATVFDLAREPLLRARLLRLDDERHLFVLTMHHIISDGWSMGVLVNEVLANYKAFSRGEESQLPPLRIQYKDYAAWQHEQLAGERLEAHQRYWHGQFADEAPALALATDFPRPAVKTYRGDHVGGPLDREAARAAQRLGQEAGASLFMVLLAAVNALLYRYTSQEDIVVGSPIAGRDRKELEGQIGFYVNTLALRTRPSGRDTFAELLETVKAVTLAAYEHQIYPFDRLVDELRLRRDASRSPLFDVLVVLQNMESAAGPAVTVEGLSARAFELENPVSKFDLSFRFWEERGELYAQIQYNTDLFRRETIERMHGHLRTLFAAAVACPGERVARLPMLTEGERRQLAGWNETAVERPREETLHGLFEEQVRRTPDAVAVVYEGRGVTYAELNRRANRVAHALRGRGVGPNVRVGVCLERSPEMVVALLAALKAGGCYVPLDPDYPAERLLFIHGDARVAVLLTSGEQFPRLPAEARRTPCLILDGDAPLEGLPDDDPRGGASGDSLAYVIYTSGSTGRPKGAMNTHRAICNRLLWMQEEYQLDSSDVVLQKTPFSFDVSVWEFFWPLITGARLVVARPDGHKDSAYLVEIINEESVTTLHFVPSMLEVFAEAGALRECPRLRRVVCSGEALSYELEQRFFRDSRAELHNLYGPTEAAVDVTYWACERESGRRFVPIGRPIANTRIHLLDPNGEPVPVGVPGELHIGGAGLARGYLNRPGLTAERFVPDAEAREAGARLYRTGDLARYHAGGEIEFLGRLDFQVKVRGFRVELGEIEAALRAHEAVRECVVVARDDEAVAPRLVAYVVFAESAARPSAGELRAFVQTTLPEHMTPALFVALERMPLTPNGKVDRAALPRPDAAAGAARYVEPSGEVERALAAAWQAVLGLERVGARDNYFDLGGDSIRAIQIASLLHRQDLELRVRHLFQFPTVESLAPHVRRLRRIADQSAVVGPVTPTPMQADFLETASPERRHHFNHGAMLRAPGGFDAEALAAVFAKLYEHHDALRLRLRPDTLTLFNEDATAPPRLDLYDLRGESDPEAALAAKADEAQASLNVEAGPLMRAALFRLPDGDRLLLALHHLAVDGLSWRILFEDIQTLYRQHREGEPLALPRKTDSFKAWTEQLAEYANSEEFLAEHDYWARVEATPVPRIERDGGSETSYVGDERTFSFALEADETELLLTRVNKAFNTETHDILLAALGLAAARGLALARLAVAVEGHGREPVMPDVDVSRTVGWFTSIYPVVLDLSDAADPSRLIKDVKETLRRIPHKGIGHGLLKRLTRPEHKRGVRFGLRPQITFNYHGQFDAALDSRSAEFAFESPGRLRDLRVERTEELGVSCVVEGGRLRASVSFSPGQHRPEKVEEFLSRYREALLGLIEHCTSRETAELTPSDLTYKELSAEALDQLFN
jgi:amino acid adenylation domain-containing protein/non-ribosomal peptide synthase protein (TIGR01720 family)